MTKLHWSSITVRLAARPALVGADRLAVLLAWLFGEAPPEARFIDAHTGQELAGSELATWDDFPLHEAMVAAEWKDTYSSGVRRRACPSGKEEHLVEAEPITRRETPSAMATPHRRSAAPRRLSWADIRVWTDSASRRVGAMDLQQRLVELTRWRLGHRSPGVWFVDVRGGASIEDPTAVDWTDFPTAKVAGRG